MAFALHLFFFDEQYFNAMFYYYVYFMDQFMLKLLCYTFYKSVEL